MIYKFGDFMQTEIAETIYEKVKILSLDKQEEVLEFVEEKLAYAENNDSRPIWEKIIEISDGIPEEEWAKLPVDGAENLDHYLYGAPKKRK